MQTATEWARANGVHCAGYIALDNYEPMPRAIERIECYRYSTDTVTDAYVLDHAYHLPHATRAIWLMDDSRTVRPFYVAAWHADHQNIIIHPFPTDVDEDGDPRLRADDGRPVDYSSWMLGPRRAYHVKVRAV
jgi:hypothetical protein